MPAVPVGDSARRAVAAATAAAMDPEEDCLLGIPAPDPESNSEAEPEGKKADGVGENAVGEKLEAGDGDGAVGAVGGERVRAARESVRVRRIQWGAWRFR